jgi:hypothetical protein
VIEQADEFREFALQMSTSRSNGSRVLVSLEPEVVDSLIMDLERAEVIPIAREARQSSRREARIRVA